MSGPRPQQPPRTTSNSGEARLVGVEIEFGKLDTAAAALLIKEHFGGQIEFESEHRASVTQTRLGDFGVELDTKYAQVENPRQPDARARELLGRAAALIVPQEIVCPPVAWHQLAQLDCLLDALRVEGAEGTDDGLLYGFGVHLNVEIWNDDTLAILRQFQAFLLMADWLRQSIGVDPTRRVLPHSNPFDRAYSELVLDSAYQPDRQQFIRDYIQANPSRNRELDLLPLLRWLDADLVDHLIDDERINARPTWHYRLPDTRLSDPSWNIATEWNRWVRTEQLAADESRLQLAMTDWRKMHAGTAPERWGRRLQELLGQGNSG